MPKMSAAGIYWPYILLGYASLFALAFLDNSRGPYFQDIIASLGLKDTSAAFFFIATSLLSFLLGRLTPRLLGVMSLIPLVRAGHVIMAAGFASVSWAESLWSLCAAAALFGVGYGIINVTENYLIVEGAAADLRRRLLSGLHAVYAFSSLVAPLTISYLIARGISWREAFLAFSLLPLVPLLLSFIGRPPAAPRTEEAAANLTAPRGAGWISCGIAFYVAAELTLSTRLAVYLRREENISAESAARYLALFFLLLFAGRFAFAFLKLQNVSNQRILQVSLVVSSVTALLGLFVSPVWLAVTGLAMAPFFGVSLTYVAETFGANAKQALASALALQSLFVVIMHFFVGAVTETWGIRAALMVTPVFLSLSLGFLIVGSGIHARSA